jgi:predicted CXXCH cytochrome family protein
VALALVVGAGLLWSCAVTEQNYATLSFFFDGVPDPTVKGSDGAPLASAQNIKDSPTYSVHKPFAEASCAECHSQAFELTPQDSSICMKCHEKKPTEYPRMHGPVAAGACLWCHSPHESAEPHLLRKAAREVCSQCHESSMLSSTKVPEHADATKNCLDCHTGHGGTASYFLRSAAEKQTRKEPPPR